MKTGFNKIDNQNVKKDKKSQELDANLAKNYPTGFLPFVWLLITWVAILAIGLSVSLNFDTATKWYDVILISSITTLLINVLWWINRIGDGSGSIEYSSVKIARGVKWEAFFDRTIYRGQENRAIKDVNNRQEFAEYRKIRRKLSKKWFTISMITQLALFACSLITWLIAYYV